jgi:hypothetical protein
LRAYRADFINIRVEELTGDPTFGNLDDFISREELRELPDRYKRVAVTASRMSPHRVPRPRNRICWTRA